MQVRYSKGFVKSYNKADPKTKQAFEKRQKLFLQDHNHPQLNDHALVGKYSGYRSINITGDWRAIYNIRGESIVFEAIGTHSQLYK